MRRQCPSPHLEWLNPDQRRALKRGVGEAGGRSGRPLLVIAGDFETRSQEKLAAADWPFRIAKNDAKPSN
jgi:hypothetical protein